MFAAEKHFINVIRPQPPHPLPLPFLVPLRVYPLSPFVPFFFSLSFSPSLLSLNCFSFRIFLRLRLYTLLLLLFSFRILFVDSLCAILFSLRSDLFSLATTGVQSANISPRLCSVGAWYRSGRVSFKRETGRIG